MAFKDMIAADVLNVFINLDEFGETRTLEYDGTVYEDVPVVLTKESNTARHIASTFTVKDHAQGLNLDKIKVHVKRDALGDLPEHGTRFYMSDPDRGGFMRSYYVITARIDLAGMVVLELEEIDE